MPPHPPFSRLPKYFQHFLPQTAREQWITLTIAIRFAFLLHFVVEYVGEPCHTAGPSMIPTMAVKGEQVWINKYYRRGRGIRVGDIVSFKHPLEPGEGAIKRVLGMSGDFVLRDTPEEGGKGLMIQIPEGHFWAVGDNVEASRDSRYYGPLPLALIKGKVTARIMPLRNAGWYENTLQRLEEDV